MATEKLAELPGERVPGGSAKYPSDWKWVSLASVCVGIYDCPHSTPVLTTDGPYLARTQDVITGVFRMSNAARVSLETYRDRVKRAEPRAGDLLYSREGTYFGIAAEVPHGIQVCLGQRMVLIRPDASHIDHRFLRYWLNCPVMSAHVHGHRDGSVAERLNLSTIRSLPIPLPQVQEQRDIAAVLGALDDKIAVNGRIAEKSDEMIRLLFLSCKDSAAPREFALLEAMNITFGSPFASSEFTERGNGRPLIRIRDLKTNDPQIWTSQILEKELLVAPGDVLAGMDAEFRPSFWLGEPGLLNQRVMHARSRVGGGPALAREALRGPLATVESYKTGTTVAHLNKSDLATLVMQVPDEDQTRRFGSAAEPLRQRIVSAAAESRVLAALRGTLLPALMSGRLRVKDVEAIVEEHV